jgi:hypothetical protein
MNTLTNSHVLYREVQRFWRPWMSLLFAPLVAIAGIVGVGLWQQAVDGIPWGNHPASNSALLVAAIVSLFGPALSFWLLYALRLTTMVDDEGIELHLWPVWHRRLSFAEIRNAFARDYSPIVEYGGWGLRLGWKGWAYNVSGRRGVQLELTQGLPVLIGSQHPEELAAAIEKVKAA